jgi:hypothetical protein
MLVGAGVGGYWNESREREWFFIGYGPTEIDSLAIAPRADHSRHRGIRRRIFDVYRRSEIRPEAHGSVRPNKLRPANVVTTMRLG